MASSSEDPVDVLIEGDDLPQLAAALEFASVGLRVEVVASESTSDLPGGPVFDPEGELTDFIELVAKPLREPAPHEFRVERIDTPAVFLLKDKAWLPLPVETAYGIPASPLDKKIINLLGFAGALRVYLDRLKPVLTVGKEINFGRLVRNRLGARATKILVQPLLDLKYGLAADDLHVPEMLPGFNEAMTRAGSLSGAVLAYSERYRQQEATVMPSCGWQEFKERLIAKLIAYGVTVVRPSVASSPDFELVDAPVDESAAQENAVQENAVQENAVQETALQDSAGDRARIVFADVAVQLPEPPRFKRVHAVLAADVLATDALANDALADFVARMFSNQANTPVANTPVANTPVANAIAIRTSDAFTTALRVDATGSTLHVWGPSIDVSSEESLEFFDDETLRNAALEFGLTTDVLRAGFKQEIVDAEPARLAKRVKAHRVEAIRLRRELSELSS